MLFFLAGVLLTGSQIPTSVSAISSVLPSHAPSVTVAGAFSTNCSVISVYHASVDLASYPLTLYEASNGSISQTSSSSSVAVISLARPLAGPITVTQCAGPASSSTPPASPGDPQLGYSTTQSSGYYGTQDKQYSDKTFLTATPNIGIGTGFFDNAANCDGGGNPCWYHIGIGNNIGGSCSSPPVVWAEYAYYHNGGYVYTSTELVCGSYWNWYTNSIVSDSSSFWNYYVNTVNYFSVKPSSDGSAVNSGGTSSFIEASSTPGSHTSYTDQVYANALQYATKHTTGSYSSIAWKNPTSLSAYNNGWSTTYWSESNSHDSFYNWAISYTWS